MEIMAKEGIGDEQYQIDFKKFKEDPETYRKPEYQIRRFIWRVPYYDIMGYQILEIGDVELEKKEIKIISLSGIVYCDYSKDVHEYLKKTINRIEKENTEN